MKPNKSGASTRRDILAITAFLVLVLAVWFGASSLPSPARVEIFGGDGVYDLRGVDFFSAVYTPVGDWQSYPENITARMK
jgi:hypothetical protein